MGPKNTKPRSKQETQYFPTSLACYVKTREEGLSEHEILTILFQLVLKLDADWHSVSNQHGNISPDRITYSKDRCAQFIDIPLDLTADDCSMADVICRKLGEDVRALACLAFYLATLGKNDEKLVDSFPASSSSSSSSSELMSRNWMTCERYSQGLCDLICETWLNPGDIKSFTAKLQRLVDEREYSNKTPAYSGVVACFFPMQLPQANSSCYVLSNDYLEPVDASYEQRLWRSVTFDSPIHSMIIPPCSSLLIAISKKGTVSGIRLSDGVLLWQRRISTTQGRMLSLKRAVLSNLRQQLFLICQMDCILLSCTLPSSSLSTNMPEQDELLPALGEENVLPLTAGKDSTNGMAIDEETQLLFLSAVDKQASCGKVVVCSLENKKDLLRLDHPEGRNHWNPVSVATYSFETRPDDSTLPQGKKRLFMLAVCDTANKEIVVFYLSYIRKFTPNDQDDVVVRQESFLIFQCQFSNSPTTSGVPVDLSFDTSGNLIVAVNGSPRAEVLIFALMPNGKLKKSERKPPQMSGIGIETSIQAMCSFDSNNSALLALTNHQNYVIGYPRKGT